MAELADAADSKSADLRVMGVRPPLPAPIIKTSAINSLVRERWGRLHLGPLGSVTVFVTNRDHCLL